jgi:hypothetical protein
MLFVSASPGQSIDLAALGRFVEERILEPPARPRLIEIVAEMPTTRRSARSSSRGCARSPPRARRGS